MLPAALKARYSKVECFDIPKPAGERSVTSKVRGVDVLLLQNLDLRQQARGGLDLLPCRVQDVLLERYVLNGGCTHRR